MSLVNEALKKARVEAARQEAAEKGIPVEALPAHLPPEQRSNYPWPLLLTALALIIIGLLSWIAFRPQSSERLVEGPGARPEATSGKAIEDAENADRAAISSRSATAPDRLAPRRAESASPPVDLDPVSATEQEMSANRSSAPRSNPLSGRSLDLPTQPLPTSETSSSSKARQERPKASSSEPASTASSHHLVAMLTNGVQLKLAGIAWSSDNPFAVINGQMLGPGESIEGFEIVNIEPSVVTLSNGERTIELRSR